VHAKAKDAAATGTVPAESGLHTRGRRMALMSGASLAVTVREGKRGWLRGLACWATLLGHGAVAHAEEGNEYAALGF